jgi:hypothetical protein
MAKPTFDAELAIRTTVNARFPKTPQRQSRPAGASGLTLDSLDNKDPAEKQELDGEKRDETAVQMANESRIFKAPQHSARNGADPKRRLLGGKFFLTAASGEPCARWLHPRRPRFDSPAGFHNGRFFGLRGRDRRTGRRLSAQSGRTGRLNPGKLLNFRSNRYVWTSSGAKKARTADWPDPV